MVVRREMFFIKKNATYKTKEKWSARNKMCFKKKVDNSWAPRKKKLG